MPGASPEDEAHGTRTTVISGGTKVVTFVREEITRNRPRTSWPSSPPVAKDVTSIKYTYEEQYSYDLGTCDWIPVFSWEETVKDIAYLDEQSDFSEHSFTYDEHTYVKRGDAWVAENAWSWSYGWTRGPMYELIGSPPKWRLTSLVDTRWSSTTDYRTGEREALKFGVAHYLDWTWNPRTNRWESTVETVYYHGAYEGNVPFTELPQL